MNLKFFPFMRQAIKNLFSKPATTQYPFAPVQFSERMRGHVEIKIEDCITCGLCARSCPPRALKVDRAAGTWSIDRFDCVQCGNCVNVCPKKCLEIVPGYTPPEAEKHTETFQCPKPAQKSGKTENRVVNDQEKCVYCTLCAKKCPQEAIAVDRGSKSWTFSPEKCVGCGLCVASCPKKCLKME